jgi:hypothetical protein
VNLGGGCLSARTAALVCRLQTFATGSFREAKMSVNCSLASQSQNYLCNP